jgi:hypothetical protein
VEKTGVIIGIEFGFHEGFVMSIRHENQESTGKTDLLFYSRIYNIIKHFVFWTTQKIFKHLILHIFRETYFICYMHHT